MDAFEQTIRQYLNLKRFYSVALFDPGLNFILKSMLSNWAKINPDKPRAQVPAFKESTDQAKLEAINRYLHGFQYRSDPVWFDFYTEPTVLQYAYEHNKWDGISCDCDDFAVWACRAAINSGIDPAQCWIGTLAPGLMRQFAGDVKYNHVVFVATLSGRTVVIDTNTAFYKSTFSTTLPDWQTALKKHWSSLYETQYDYLILEPYPFRL